MKDNRINDAMEISILLMMVGFDGIGCSRWIFCGVWIWLDFVSSIWWLKRAAFWRWKVDDVLSVSNDSLVSFWSRIRFESFASKFSGMLSILDDAVFEKHIH